MSAESDEFAGGASARAPMIAGQGNMLYVNHEPEEVTLGCQKVTGTLIQYFLQIPKALAAEKGLLPEGD